MERVREYQGEASKPNEARKEVRNQASETSSILGAGLSVAVAIFGVSLVIAEAQSPPILDQRNIHYYENKADAALQRISSSKFFKAHLYNILYQNKRLCDGNLYINLKPGGSIGQIIERDIWNTVSNVDFIISAAKDDAQNSDDRQLGIKITLRMLNEKTHSFVSRSRVAYMQIPFELSKYCSLKNSASLGRR